VSGKKTIVVRCQCSAPPLAAEKANLIEKEDFSLGESPTRFQLDQF
jgi:hypothetical protein